MSPMSSIPLWPEHGGGFHVENTCTSPAGELTLWRASCLLASCGVVLPGPGALPGQPMSVPCSGPNSVWGLLKAP